MKRTILFASLIALATFGLFGCGGGGSAGLNGSISLTAQVQGTNIVGTVIYTNPNKTDLIGTEITLSTDQPDVFGPPFKFNTNNSGAATFTLPAVKNFDGTISINLVATTGNLHDYVTNLQMTGRTISMTAPANQTLAVAFADGSDQTIILDKTPFVTISDPIGNNVNGHTINVVTTVTLTGMTASLAAPASVTTNTSGIASLTGATLTATPPPPGKTGTAVITWTATDNLTGLSVSGTTTVTVNRAAS